MPVRIPPAYRKLGDTQGIMFEMKPIFSYKVRVLIDEKDTDLQFVPCMVRFVGVRAALTVVIYDECHLWYLKPYIIGFAHCLSTVMETELGWPPNARKLSELFVII